MKTIKYIAAFLPLASLLVSCNDDFLGIFSKCP